MNKNKLISFLAVFAASVLLLIACSTEKPSPWSSFEWEKVGGFTMEGNNMSPLKEITVDCDTVIVRVDEFSSPEPVIFHFLLIYEDTHIIAEELVLPATTKGENIELSGKVKKGDRLSVFTQVFKEDGTYDPNLTCKLSYSYRLK